MGDNEKLIQELRAIIISSKGGITFRDLRRDFLELGGSESMHKKLGFRSLESFVQSNPKEFSVNQMGLVFAAIKEESQHIQRLVNQQAGKPRSRIDFRRPSLRPASRYNVNSIPAHNSMNRKPQKYPINKNLPPTDLRYVLNEKKSVQPLLEIDFSDRQVQENNNTLTVKKEWPKELFSNNTKDRHLNKYEIPPRFRPQVEDIKKTVSQEEPKQLPIFKYKAKVPIAREPYRHDNLSHTNNLSKKYDDDDDEELFKDVPPLDDPKPAQTKKTPVTENEPIRIQSEAQTQQPKLPVSLPPKNPAASRFARIQAETQIQTLSSTNSLTQLSDLRSRFDEFCRAKDISGPEIKVMSHIHGAEKLYTCLVKVGSDVFSSDFGSEPSVAEISALRKAFNALHSEPEPKINDTATTLYLSRLKSILQEKSNGMWMNQLPTTYMSVYGENVPTGWEEAVITSSDFFTSMALGKLLVYPQKTGFTTSSDSNKTQPASIQLPETNKRTLPVLTTPEDRYWDVYVLMCLTPSELVTRLIGRNYSDKHDDLHSMLEMDMLTERNHVSAPIVGEIYAVCTDGYGCLRGRLESILPNKMCHVYFVDEGHTEDLTLDKLYHLDDKYFDLPAQAIKIVLKGLENFPATSLFNTISDYMSRRICVAEIIDSYPGQFNGVVASTILWDTTTDVDVNLNRQVMEDTVSSLVDPSTYHDYPRDMIISHVEDDVYLQTADKGIDCISSLTDFIFTCNSLLPVKSIAFKKVYLAVNSIDNMYVRAKVREVYEDKCLVYFIDFGSSYVVDKTELFDVENICPALTKAPSQALKVTLGGVGRLHSSHKKYLKLLVESKVSVVVTILQIDNGVPCVSLHRRMEQNANLQNVNNILMAAENEKEKPVQKALPTATLPALKSFFSIRVTLAVSPSVFMVQYNGSLNIIHDLMEKLQSCNLETTANLLVDDIECDMTYAVEFKDNWYRAEVTHDMGNGDFGIKLSDFGNSAIVPVTSFRQLPETFYQHPKLAIRASLADTTPINRDWCPADCVFFQEAVMDRDLAGILKAITYDDDDEPVLVLQLIDTSGDDDIDISNLLIENGIANQC